MNQKRISQVDFFSAAGFMLLSAASLACIVAFGKDLTTLADFSVVIFLRFLGPFILSGVIYLALKGATWQTTPITPHLLRAVFTVGCQYCLFILLLKGNLLNATLLFSTSGLFMPFIARLFLKAEIKIKTLIATAISFTGVVITLGPTSGLLSSLTLIGLLAGFLRACSQITLHYSSKRQDITSINLLMYGFSSLFAFIIVLLIGDAAPLMHFFSRISWLALGVVFGVAIFSLSSQIFRACAYKRVNKAASLVPFLYTSIVFSGGIDWVWFGIMPSLHVYVGTLVVIIGSVIMSVRKVKH